MVNLAGYTSAILNVVIVLRQRNLQTSSSSIRIYTSVRCCIISKYLVGNWEIQHNLQLRVELITDRFSLDLNSITHNVYLMPYQDK
ncbi:hypothetical protein EWB00_009642 [Schistosoma japonicum]|uniref:Uncharacterized protein n=1 Tax=Schistosoma japonicum TaxID=6182 RepID=A0A4Z2CLL9_SCHJA|nr:hypothetical protein EWB00_009642 [Schistosoma japonicum]